MWQYLQLACWCKLHVCKRCSLFEWPFYSVLHLPQLANADAKAFKRHVAWQDTDNEFTSTATVQAFSSIFRSYSEYGVLALKGLRESNNLRILMDACLLLISNYIKIYIARNTWKTIYSVDMLVLFRHSNCLLMPACMYACMHSFIHSFIIYLMILISIWLNGVSSAKAQVSPGKPMQV